ncbi:MAG: hypothetical protein JXA41_01130 [Deltaproteobacteria bacterium]|nr:hypothetical protein [Deltaproteobacteria bacterium]
MVSPIARQQSILQSSIVERIQQTQQQHPDMQQRYFEIQLREERKKMLQKAKDTEEAQNARIRDEDDRKRQADDQETQESAENDVPTEETMIDPDAPGHVDVKV